MGLRPARRRALGVRRRRGRLHHRASSLVEGEAVVLVVVGYPQVGRPRAATPPGTAAPSPCQRLTIWTAVQCGLQSPDADNRPMPVPRTPPARTPAPARAPRRCAGRGGSRREVRVTADGEAPARRATAPVPASAWTAANSAATPWPASTPRCPPLGDPDQRGELLLVGGGKPREVSADEVGDDRGPRASGLLEGPQGRPRPWRPGWRRSSRHRRQPASAPVSASATWRPRWLCSRGWPRRGLRAHVDRRHPRRRRRCSAVRSVPR